MAKRFITPFAQLGDRDSIPNEPSGNEVNYQTGYTAPYESNPETDPDAKFVERDKTNQLFNDITANIQEWQNRVYPEFVSPSDNGGASVSYDKNALVYFSDVLYKSLKDNNTDTPNQSGWVEYSDSASLISNDNGGSVQGFIDQSRIYFSNVDEMLAATIEVGRKVAAGTSEFVKISNSNAGIYNFKPESNMYLVDFLPTGYSTTASVSYFDELQDLMNYTAYKKPVIMTDFDVLLDVDGSTYGGLDVPSGTKFINPNQYALKLKPTALASYEVLGIRNRKDVELHNPVVIGDKYTHLGTTGEFGMGISIRGSCENIKVFYPRVSEVWGDGYYIGQISNGDGTAPKSITITNPIAKKCRRQGMSVTSVDGLFLYDCEFYDTKSSDSSTPLSAGPHAGIDIEPNDYNSKLQGIYISNIKGGDNDAGLFYVFLGAIETPAANRYNVDINVSNITDSGSRGAAEFIGVNKDSLYSGSINITSVNSNIAKSSPVRIRNWAQRAGIPINIDVVSASNWNVDDNAETRDLVPVSIYQTSSQTYPAVGNVYIDRLNVRSTRASIAGALVWVENGTSGAGKDINIGVGAISTNNPNMFISASPGGVTARDIGTFGSKMSTPISSSSTLSLAFIRDYIVTSPSGNPTIELPIVSNEGTKIRFRYTPGGTGTGFRLRSLNSSMFVNGQPATNITFTENSGTINLEAGLNGYYISCLGSFAIES